MAKNKYEIIAGYKIDTIAGELTKSFEAKVKKITKQMSEAAKEVFLAKMPKDILEFWEKYPDLVRTNGQMVFQIDGKKGLGLSPVRGFIYPGPQRPADVYLSG